MVLWEDFFLGFDKSSNFTSPSAALPDAECKPLREGD